MGVVGVVWVVVWVEVLAQQPPPRTAYPSTQSSRVACVAQPRAEETVCVGFVGMG